MKVTLIGYNNSITATDKTSYTIGEYTHKRKSIGDETCLTAVGGGMASVLCRFAEAPTDEQGSRIIAHLLDGIHRAAKAMPRIVNVRDLMADLEGVPALYVEPEQPSEESAKPQMHTPSVAGSGKTFFFDRVKVSPETAERIIEGLLSLSPTPLNIFVAQPFNSTIHPASLRRQGWKWIGPESEKSSIWKKGETRITYRAGESFGDDGHVSSIIVFGTEYMLHPVITKFSVLEEKIAELEKLQGGPRQAKETEQPAKVNETRVQVLRSLGWAQDSQGSMRWLKQGNAGAFFMDYTSTRFEAFGNHFHTHDPEAERFAEWATRVSATAILNEESAKVNVNAVSSNDSNRPEIILRENGWEWDIPNQQYNKDGVDGWILIDPNGACLYDKGIRPFWPLIWDRIKPFRQWLLEDVEGKPAQLPSPKEVLKANGWVPTGAITWRSKFHPTLEVRTSGRGDWSVYRHADPKGGTNEWNPKQFPNFEDWLVPACAKWEWSPLKPQVEDLSYRQRVVQALGWVQDATYQAVWRYPSTKSQMLLYEDCSYTGLGNGDEQHNPGMQPFAKWASEVTGKAQATIKAQNTGSEDTREIEATIQKHRDAIQTLFEAQQDFSGNGKGYNKLQCRIDYLEDQIEELEDKLGIHA